MIEIYIALAIFATIAFISSFVIKPTDNNKTLVQ